MLKPDEAINTSYPISKKWVLYLLLENNRPIPCYGRNLAFRNGKGFRRLTILWIKGWSNYYSTVVSKETFSKVNHLTYEKLRAWANYRGNINKDKYWRTVGNRNWCFSTEDGLELTTHSSTPIISIPK